MTALRALLLALLALPLAAPAWATHPPDPDVLVAWTTTGGGWSAHRIRANGTELALFEAVASASAGPAGVGVAFYAANGNGSFSVAFADTRAGRLVQAQAAGDVTPLLDRPAPGHDGFGIGAVCRGGCFEGEYVAVLYGVGDAVTVHVRMGNAVVLNSTSGSGAFLHGAEDFAAAAGAHAELDGRGGFAMLDGRLAKPVGDRLFGAFLAEGSGALTLRADTPTGTRACPCHFGQTGAAGAHAFRLQGVALQPGAVALLGADVRTPS